ncbi:MAG TPA: PAS domain S-box protein, partial [Anaerolineales bacterium]|nr:PAS domain S-box protein [Anaerolineales bacterium]
MMDKNQIQVLLIEDNLTDAILLREALGADALTAFSITVVERLQSAVEILQGQGFDIILLDLGLPDGHGLETFTRLHQVVPQIPKVILSGLSDETLATQSVHAGAQDYLVKGATGFASAARAIRYALERQRAQAAVRASEERFRAMIENGLDDISLLDAEGKLIWESPAVVRNLGYAENEFVGRSLFELVHPDDLGWIRGLFLKLLQEPQHRQEGIGRLRHADGSWHWIEAVVTNLLANPNVQAIVVNYRDITERKQAEDTIRGLARFPEENPNPIFRIRADGQIMYANSPSRYLLEAWNLSVNDPLPADWNELVADSFRKNSRQTHDVSVHERTYSILIVPFRDAGYINIYGRDLTESRQAETKLRENAEDEALINSLNDAANRGESLEGLVRLLGEKFTEMFYAKGTGLYLLGEDGRSLNMPGFSLPEGVIGNLEKLIGRHIPPLKIPIRDGGIFQRFLHNPGGTILTDPQEIQQWMMEFTGVETVPAGLDMVVSKLVPHFYQILGIGSTISLPLISSGRTVGLLGISSANMLSHKELERLRKIGVQLSSAIQRKQDEQHLFESNERFEQLANNIEEAFWITKAQTRDEIYMSPAAEKIWGLPIEELRKPNAFRTHILPDDLPIVETALARQRQGEKTEIEYRITRPDGSIHWIWDRSFPIYDSEGKLLSNAGLSTDITEIKEAQSELELLNRTLE